jgi:hypothetical protein
MPVQLEDCRVLGFLDELQKIAEEAQKQPGPITLKRVLPAAAAGALGIGTGYILSDWASMKFDPLRKAMERPTTRSAQVAKVVLPILGGAAFMLADRYRRKMDEASREPANKK